jgi:predicted small lipoprotein YifL
MRLLILATLLTLTACGADAPPLTPSSASPPPESSISITGDVSVGVTTKIN